MRMLNFANGDKMPALGLGTWKATGTEAREGVYNAIKAGYRHLDCAAKYGNEKEVGLGIHKAIKEGLVKREDLWITSKLWNNSHEKGQVMPAIKKTLHDLQLEYLDLYLIHWPVAFESDAPDPKESRDFQSLDEVPLTETWHKMEEIKARGISHHIGVSNFNKHKIQKLIDKCTEKPEMNQIELHPYLQQDDLVQWCQNNNIHLTAYSPLGSGDRPDNLKKEDDPSLLNNKTVRDIANKYDCHPAQILIAWSLRRGTAVIPKSTDTEHQKTNLQSANIKLDDEDMEQIAELDKGYRFIDGREFVMEDNPYTVEQIWEK